MSEHGQILCDECGVNAASCNVAMVMGEKTLHRRLCQQCMARMGMSLATGNIQKVLGALLAAAQNKQAEASPTEEEPAIPEENAIPETELPVPAEAMPPADEAVCPRCGMVVAAFLKNGRLGCAACYAAFRPQLVSFMESFCPALQHTGRRPLKTEAALHSRARREEMQRLMDEAVRREDFETAARLRDALHAPADEEVEG